MKNGESILIRGGRVIDPASSHDATADVLIAAGRVRRIGKVTESTDRTIDAGGLIVCPGLIDMHVHLREPGNEDEETIATGTAAAVSGGFTTVACMPNTNPPLDNEAAIEFVFRQAARSAHCNVLPIGALTKARAGKELAEIGQMVRAGAAAFSDDGSGVANPAVMLRAMQYVGMFGKPVIQHCEDPDLAAGGCMHQGLTSTRLGLPGIPAVAEEAMIQRDVLLASITGAHYHVAHISTARSVEMVREAKRRGISVTSEVTPHHLLLSEESCASYDTHFKVNPPLRTQADVAACVAGVGDGTIDCLVTDHAPHGAEEKELEFQNAPFGMVGLETAVPLTIRALIDPGIVDWPRWVACWTSQPARILGISRGTLGVGAVADVTLINPDIRWRIEPGRFVSRSRNTPFGDWQVRGRAVCTIVDGEVRFSEEEGVRSPRNEA